MSIVNIDRDLQQAIYREKAAALYELWIGSPEAQSLLVGGKLSKEDDAFIHAHVKEGFGGIYSLEALNDARDECLAKRQIEAEDVAAQQRLLVQIEKYCEEQHIAQTDKIINIAEEIERGNPPLTFEKFANFVELHPDRVDALIGFRAFSLLDAVRHAPAGQAELRWKYGSGLVDQALQALAQRIHKGTEQIEDRRAAEGVSNKHSLATKTDFDKEKELLQDKANDLEKVNAQLTAIVEEKAQLEQREVQATKHFDEMRKRIQQMGPVSSRQSVELNKATVELNRAKYDLDKAVLDLDTVKRKEVFLTKVKFQLERKTAAIEQQIDAVISNFRVGIGGDRTSWGSTWDARKTLRSLVDQAKGEGRPGPEILELVKAEATKIARAESVHVGRF